MNHQNNEAAEIEEEFPELESSDPAPLDQTRNLGAALQFAAELQDNDDPSGV